VTAVKTDLIPEAEARRTPFQPVDGIPATDTQEAVEAAYAAAAAAADKFPASSTDEAVARYDGTTGDLQNSGVLISDTNALTPATNDGGVLGTSALRWGDLFGATGFVVNFGGDWVATHSAAVWTVGTGDLRVTNAGANAASVVTVGGSQTLTNKTLTSPTVNTPTISGGTINNNTIGGTTPAAATVTTLTTTGNIELGNASDTTLSRASAGRLAVEGVNAVTISSTDTLTNKSVDLTNNTLTGTTAQFNTALTDDNFGVLGGTNTWTAQQTFNSGAATTQNNVYSDNGAAEGPRVNTERISASPAADDVIGVYAMQGRNSAAGTVTYAKIIGQIRDATNATEDGEAIIVVVINGTLNNQLSVGGGVSIGQPTGGLQGPGTLNLDNALFRDGVQVVGSRVTGWTAATNTKSKATFDTTTVTLPQLAARVGQIIDDLIAHGLTGT